MKRSLAIVLAVLTMLATVVVPVAAAETEVTGEYGVDYAKYGDINLDNAIDAADALEALKKAVGKVELDEIKTELADVNNDELIDAADALEILKFAVGKVTAFAAGDIYQITEPAPEPVWTEDYIANYDKSNSVNGAYELDPTADTSYKVDISSLDANTLYRCANACMGGNFKAEDGTNYAFGADAARLIHSLQGLVNRDFGMDKDHTTMVYTLKDGSDSGWLDYISDTYDEAKGQKNLLQEGDTNILATDDKLTPDVKEGMTEVRISNFAAFMEKFSGVIKSCGIILWDGNVPATANVAATICGLDGYLPVLKHSPLHNYLVAQGVEVKMDLSGMFVNNQKGTKIVGTDIASTGSAKNDAYLWALEKYFNRCSSTYLAYTLDGAATLSGYSAYPDHVTASLGGDNCLSNHDYLIARRCFFYDLMPVADEIATDDPAQKADTSLTGLDLQTTKKIFAARYKRADADGDGVATFGQLMGFPPWWAKYTNHKNQGQKPATTVEWLFTEYLTCYNLAKEADAQAPASMTNGSVFYKHVPHEVKYTNNKKAENIQYDPNTYYYTIYVGDYDSSAWLKTHIYDMWYKNGGDRNRGKIQQMWSINPNLSYRVPMVFDYMYENLTDMDYMVGGDGGAGYIVPEALYHNRQLAYIKEYRPTENKDSGDEFAKYSKVFYDRFDMDITGFVINGDNNHLYANVAKTLSDYAPVGSFYNIRGQGNAHVVTQYGNTPFVYCMNGIGDSANSSTYSAMHSYTNGYMSGKNFGCYRTICNTPSENKAIVEGYNQYLQGKTIGGQALTPKYVDPYTLFNMVREASKVSSQVNKIG